MHGTAHKLCFFGLLLMLVSLAYGINYLYFSNEELTPNGDRIRFWHEDTLCGPIRTNAQFAIMENPVFCDFVIQSDNMFITGPGYNPFFEFEPGPFFNSPTLPMPTQATQLREHAFEQGLFFNAGPNMEAWAKIMHDTLRVRWAEIGEPFDPLNYQDVLLPDSANVFFDAALRVSGVVSTVLIMGASGRVGLEDNIYYASTGYFPPVPPVEGHTERFALISENELKVLNTPANGRDNSNGQGFPQPNPELTDIVLHGIYVALNQSFTFENQNDPDSVYSGPSPDDRGTIYLWGSLMQSRRNYVHRSNHGSTGYAKQYRYDDDLRFWKINLWSDTLRENVATPASLDFGEVSGNDTMWLSVDFYNDFIPVWLENIAVVSGAGFFTEVTEDSTNWAHHLQVGFSPVEPGLVTGELTFENPYYNQVVSIPLQAVGLTSAAGDFAPQPASFSLSAYPNPFNAVATISYALPFAAEIELKVMDVLGREVQTIYSGAQTAGSHTVQFDAANFTSGLYFARLQTQEQTLIHKLLLIK